MQAKLKLRVNFLNFNNNSNTYCVISNYAFASFKNKILPLPSLHSLFTLHQRTLPALVLRGCLGRRWCCDLAAVFVWPTTLEYLRPLTVAGGTQSAHAHDINARTTVTVSLLHAVYSTACGGAGGTRDGVERRPVLH